VARPTSNSTDGAMDRAWDRAWRLRSMALVVVALGVLQAATFYDHFAVALTVLFGLGLGLWLRTWQAAVPAVLAFFIAYLLAIGTGWLHDARPLWEPLLGAMLAALGGLIGGGIFDVLRRDREARAPGPVPMDSIRWRS
jgi:hypothetical protein